MRTLKPMTLTALSAPFEWENKVRLVVVVGAMVSLDGTALEQEQTLWKALAEAPGFPGNLDELKPKVRGEALLVGHVFAPGGKPAPIVAAKLEVGSIKKEVWAVGDRVWKHGVPTEPEPFERMPLTYERAFGGEGHAPNPKGKGAVPVQLESGATVHPLPNLEIARKLITSPRDKPAPAGFGPIDPSWPDRMKKLGTYDKKWFETKYPDFADDFDPTYFNMAPEDQWIEGYFSGDEPFVLENLHPEKTRIEGRLPGLVARGFVNKRGEAGESLREIPMRCDTLWFVPNLERVVLVFRGIVEVADEDASDVTDLLVALEWRDRPRDIDYYRSVREKRLDKDKGAMYALHDADLIPEGMKGAKASSVSDLDGLLATEGLPQEFGRRRAQRELDQMRAELEANGIDPDAHLPKEVPAAAEPPDMANLPLFVETVEKQAADTIKHAEEQRETMLRELRELCQENGIDFDAQLEAARREASGPPKFSAEDEMERLQELALLSRNAGVPVPEVDKLTDPNIEDKLRQAEFSLKDMYRRAVHYLPPAYTLEGDEAARVRREVEEALAAGASLAGRDMTGADLRGLDFSGRDVCGAFFEKAELEGCSFRGANAERAVFARANLAGADFHEARLVGANFGEANLTRARLTGGLDLTEAVFVRATLAEADLSGATLDKAEMSEAHFDKTLAARIKARDLTILKSDFRGVDLSGAALINCNILETNVQEVDFSGATLTGTVLLDVEGDGAIFRDANLEGLRVVRVEKGSSLARADFRGANMRGANLRGVNLAASDLRDTDLSGAELSRCDLRGAKLEGARAVEARFMRADLTDADLSRSDLMNTLLGGAVVRGANFEEANVFRADAAKMVGDDRTSFQGANVKQVRVTPNRGGHG